MKTQLKNNFKLLFFLPFIISKVDPAILNSNNKNLAYGLFY